MVLTDHTTLPEANYQLSLTLKQYQLQTVNRTMTPTPYSLHKSSLRRCYLFLLLLLVSHFSCQTPKGTSTIPMRIVSLAPSITETLFAMGLGEKVVGVTSFCHFPSAVNTIQKVGGYSDANLEQIVTLKPDLVILQWEHEKQRNFLDRYGIHTLSVDYSSVEAICHSFITIGKKCGVLQQADSLAQQLAPLVQSLGSTSKRPKIMVCVGRGSAQANSVQSVYAASKGTFYNNVIEAAGGINALQDSLPHYPKLSQEGIITLAPDIVIDIASAMGEQTCARLIADWSSLTILPAVSQKQVFCIDGDYATIPGPRLINLLQDIQEIVERANN